MPPPGLRSARLGGGGRKRGEKWGGKRRSSSRLMVFVCQNIRNTSLEITFFSSRERTLSKIHTPTLPASRFS